MATKTKASSRGTKTATKKKGLLSRINFRSRKTQFVATIALIAVAGAGYFTYSSFAATVGTFATNNGGLACQSTSARLGYCRSVTEPSKSNSKVLQLSSNYQAVAVAAGNVPVTGGRQYNTCVTAKGQGYLQITPTANAANSVTFNDPNQYVTQCIRNWTANITERLVPTIYNFGAANGSGTLRVSLITVEDVTASSPAPAPAK